MSGVPDELVEAARLALNERVDGITFRKASEGHPHAERLVVRAVLSAASDAGYSICKFPVFPEEAEA